jgi:hypothetical protein
MVVHGATFERIMFCHDIYKIKIVCANVVIFIISSLDLKIGAVTSVRSNAVCPSKKIWLCISGHLGLLAKQGSEDTYNILVGYYLYVLDHRYWQWMPFWPPLPKACKWFHHWHKTERNKLITLLFYHNYWITSKAASTDTFGRPHLHWIE